MLIDWTHPSTRLPRSAPVHPWLTLAVQTSRLLLSSGTMGNLIAAGVHCRRGDEIILGSESHMIHYEAGGASAFMGVAYRTITNQPDGGLDVVDIDGAVRADDQHYPR